MKTIEISGRTLEEALRAAAVELGVSSDEVEYETLEEGSKGFIGLGQTPTLIKAWATGADAQKKPEKVVEQPKPVKTEVVAPVISEPASVDTAEVSEKAVDVPATNQEYAQAAVEVLSVVLPAMGLEAHAVVKSVDAEYVHIDILGTDLAILIGKHGQTLDALQYLLQIAASKKVRCDARIVLDAEGYRDRHNKLLEKKALEYALAVKEQQREAVLDPQPARDRRIIHVTLVDHPDVYTYSEGFGDDRHVVISPKK